MAGVGWQDVIDRADSEQEVVRVVRDFVASLSPYDLARLPSQCRPGKFFGAEDVTSFAFEIVRHHCDQDVETRDLVHRIAAFFSQASTRLSQLLAHCNRSGVENYSA